MPEHIALAALLAPHYPLAIISNTNDAHIAHAEANYSSSQLFSVRIYSHEAKAAKPDPAIYQAALKALGNVDPLETLSSTTSKPTFSARCNSAGRRFTCGPR